MTTVSIYALALGTNDNRSETNGADITIIASHLFVLYL